MKKSRGVLVFLAGALLMLAAGWIAFPLTLYRSIDQPLQFSHKIHTGESVGLTCETCHTFDSEGRFNGVPSLEQCAGCHASQLGTTDEEKKLVDEYVSRNREIPWLVYARQPDNVFFPHLQHVRQGAIPCERCHGPHGSSDRLRPLQVNRISGYSRDIWGESISRLGAQPWEGMKMDDCIGCHAQQGRSDGCIECHK